MRTKNIGELRAPFVSSDAHASITAEPVPATADEIEELQLKRLAGALLARSQADLAALMVTNPMIVWEWVEAFRSRKQKAEAEARYWSAAMAALTIARPDAARTAAE
jgi:hypothetical protein